jgi:aldehyde dehydrogenase (NAD+)
MAAAGLGKTVSELRQAYESGRTRSLAWRQAQLRGLLRLLEEQEEAAFHALHEDLGKHRAEAYRDEVVTFPGLISARTHVSTPLRLFDSSPQVGLVVKSANEALRHLGKWMTPEKVTISIRTLGVAADSSPIKLTTCFSPLLVLTPPCGDVFSFR